MVEDSTRGEAPRAGGSSPSADATRQSTTRRQLLRTGAAVGVGSAVLGRPAAANHSGASTPDREVDGDSCLEWGGGSLQTGDVDVLLNDWATGGECGGSPDTEMCISTYGDGSFGWEWARYETCIHGEDLPNYPQALMGRKIGGTDSGWRGLPRQTRDIEDFDVYLDVDQERSDGEWNFMLEWWMDFDEGIGEPTDEILIVLEASEVHAQNKGEYVHEAAIEDDYGNTIHYWENDVEGGNGADWNFHIFGLDRNDPNGYVDLRSVLDYLVEDPRGDVQDGGGTYNGDKWVSGVEVGNEYFDNTDGETIVSQFSVRVNDQVGAAGVEDGFPEREDLPPSAPSNVSVTGTSDSSVSLSWSASSDPDGTVDHYEVEATGAAASTTSSTTSATVGGLQPDTAYEFTVTAVDDDGNASSASSPVTATTEGGVCSGAVEDTTLDDGSVVCDLDGDGAFRDVNADGTLGQDDVVHFFENQHRDAWQDASLFDFSENGSVGHGDVVSLFEYVAVS